MSGDAGRSQFFERVAAYYEVRCWQRPGSPEQFDEAVRGCWGLKCITADDGERYYIWPDDDQVAP